MSLYSGIPRYASFGRVNIESERSCDKVRGGIQMIEHIRDIIAWGLNEDFWSEDSLLVEGYYNTFNEVLNCEGFTIWDDQRNTVYITLQNGKEYKITIEEGEVCI